MPDIPIDKFGFWIFLIPGFMTVWSFRYFTDSEKKGDFEFVGLAIICGFINLLFIGLASKVGLEFPDSGDLAVDGFGITIIAFFIGFLGAQISKWIWFRSAVKFLKSSWF